MSHVHLQRAGRSVGLHLDVAWWLCLAFFLLVFVGFSPFSVASDSYLNQLESGQGDSLRQLSYLIIFGSVLFIHLSKYGIYRFLSVLPVAVMVALAWYFLTSFWSIAPEISLRRLGLTTIVMLSVAMFEDILGPQALLRLLWYFFIPVLIVDLLSIKLVSTAVHQGTDFEWTEENIGAWRGMHFEKNVAGMTAAMAAILYLHVALTRRHVWSWLLLIGWLVFLIGTQSKTSIYLCAASFVLGSLYVFAGRHPRARFFIGFGAVIALILASGVALLYWPEVSRSLADPTVFTNRGYIWQTALMGVAQRPWLGFGFRSFWMHTSSPVIWLADPDAPWVAEIGHSHSGYLEILVGTGAIGLTLGLVAMIIVPAWRLMSAPKMPFGDLAISWIFFFFTLNITEVEFFERDRPAWVIFLIAVTIAYRGRLTQRAGSLAAAKFPKSILFNSQ